MFIILIFRLIFTGLEGLSNSYSESDSESVSIQSDPITDDFITHFTYIHKHLHNFPSFPCLTIDQIYTILHILNSFMQNYE